MTKTDQANDHSESGNIGEGVYYSDQWIWNPVPFSRMGGLSSQVLECCTYLQIIGFKGSLLDAT